MPNTTQSPALDPFVALSEELCGIPAYFLQGTGYAERYLDTVLNIVGADSLNRLLDVYSKLPSCCQGDREAAFRANLLGHPEFGPIARNIIKLWYTATWFELPSEWRQQYGRYANDRTFLPFPYAYPESLLGPAVGAHPAGAKPTGHQSWTSPPDYLPVAKAAAPEQCTRVGQMK